MAEQVPFEVRALGVDAGGTMTDTIITDRSGRFVVGKAQTTPELEAKGFTSSIRDALRYWDLTPEQAFPTMVTGVFSGTSMLNRLLERKGQRVGVVVTRGMEDYFRFERGVQTHLGYSYADSLHVVTHEHHAPLVPRSRMKGVGGRIDASGQVAIPLREEEARDAVRDLLKQDVDCICINFIFSWRNNAHEARVKELAQEVFKETGKSVPLFLSSELYPKRLDFPRLNTLVIDAYAAEPSRKQLHHLRDRTQEFGAKFDLRVMSGSGSAISIESKQLVTTLASGPIGGCVAAKYLADNLNLKNLVCSDIGGTSFDVALITGGEYEVRNDPEIAHFKLGLPMIRLDSIGAGCGSFVRVNPISHRIEIGPDSAGSRIGVCNPAGNIDTVTITDCNVALGVLNPDYFLGGEVILDPKLTWKAIEEQIAKPLNLTVEQAARGVIDLFEDELRREVRALVLGKGFAPEDFALLSYGGGGPLHVGGYTDGLNFMDVLVPTWAAGFSAFGCVCADFAYRVDHQIDVGIPAFATDEQLGNIVESMKDIWADLKTRVKGEFSRSGVPAAGIEFRPLLRVQYMGQLNDIEVISPVAEIKTAADMRAVLNEFENTYARVYANSARSPELGYMITLAIMRGTVPVEKPALPNEPLDGKTPPSDSLKQSRKVYSNGRWIEAKVYDMDKLRAGNVLDGFSIVEAPSTTFIVPEGRTARLDPHRIFHLQNR